jgi:hypothetical protein
MKNKDMKKVTLVSIDNKINAIIPEDNKTCQAKRKLIIFFIFFYINYKDRNNIHTKRQFHQY